MRSQDYVMILTSVVWGMSPVRGRSKGNRLLPASCVTPVTNGMEVETETDAVVQARKTILELLVANHPLDCMTCDKMGACKLADYCYKYEVKDSPFVGERHHYPLDDSNPFIIRDMNKCILCGACVRACEEMTGQDNLSYLYRGFDRKATTAMYRILNLTAYFVDNVAVCPTAGFVENMSGKPGWILTGTYHLPVLRYRM